MDQFEFAIKIVSVVAGLVASIIALYVAKQLATMENRLFLRINGTYVRAELFREFKSHAEAEIRTLQEHSHEDRSSVNALALQVARLEESERS